MTGKDSADGVLKTISVAGSTTAWNIANLVLDGCGLTHATANLQGFGNLGNGAGPQYASFSGPVLNKHPANAGVAKTQSLCLPNKDANQINKLGRQTNSYTNKRAKVDK